MNVYLGGLYKEVEYIQSSGTQYIDTGYIPSNNTKIEMSMGGFNSSTSSNSLFGARYSWNTDASIGRGFGWSVNASTSPYGYGGMFGRRYSSGSDNFNVFSWGNGGNHILSLDQSGFYQDGVKKYTPNTVTFTSPVNLYIFALNDNGNLAEKTNYKLYYFKVWNNGTLVRDFVPCYRVSDNVIGLFDKVENKFYANAGTGSFTKGNDVKVFQAELKNAYIGENPGFEYSYDFRGKTSSQVISDGWSYGDSTTGIGCDSNGLYGTSNGSRLIMYTDFDMRNASKITLEAQVKTETDYDLNFGLCSSIQRTNGTYIYQCRYNYDGVGAGGFAIVVPDWNDYNGTYAWKYVIDLDAKTYSVTRTMGGLTGYSGSITDTMVSNIRNNPMYLMVLSSAKTGCRMQKVSALIE